MSNLLQKVDWPRTGKYVVAVSGGIDSVVLLHMLIQQGGYELAAAHLDHGMRPDSASDARFVASLARAYGLKFVTRRVELGNASEEAAREARYKFLRQAQANTGALAVLTAHHLDDRLETSLFNLLRGSNRHGFTSLNSSPGLLRPLLSVSRREIESYARAQGLKWREDPTNLDTTKSRNYLRHVAIPRLDKLNPGWRPVYLDLMSQTQQLNRQIDKLLDQLVVTSHQDMQIDRRLWDKLDGLTQRQLLSYALRLKGITLPRPAIERLVGHIATGNQFDLPSGFKLRITARQLVLTAQAPRPPVPQVQVPVDHQVRQWQPGDRIRLSYGSKKLQDLFVDAKIERAARQIWPVVVNARNEVVWVPQLTPPPF